MTTTSQPAQVTVQESGLGRFQQDVLIGDHLLIADEPVTSGGNNAGPSPYDFILAGLGACTAMTLRMYANLKKIPLTKVIVKLSIEKIHAKDCENCAENAVKIDHITRIVELQGELNAEQRAKLLDIANRCPVHRTLTSTISITTKLVEAYT